MKEPQRSPVSTSREPTPPAEVMPPAKVLTHSPQVPLTDAEEALSATRGLSDYTRRPMCFLCLGILTLPFPG